MPRPALCLWLLISAGCAYLPRTVRLQPPEPPAPGAAAPCIEVEKLKDARADPLTVGVVRNGLYWATASARTPDDVTLWVTTYLRAALGAPNGAVCESGLVLSGALDYLFVDEYLNLDGRLTVRLRLERRGQVLLERGFDGAASQLSQLGSDAEFEQTLRKTLASLADNAIPAIRAAAAQPPPPAGL